MLGLIWTMAYWLVAKVTPRDAFAFNTGTGTKKSRWTGFNAFYFSFITLSTVGYGGSITPVSRIARWLAAMEAMTGIALCGSPNRRISRGCSPNSIVKSHVGNSTPTSDDSLIRRLVLMDSINRSGMRRNR